MNVKCNPCPVNPIQTAHNLLSIQLTQHGKVASYHVFSSTATLCWDFIYPSSSPLSPSRSRSSRATFLSPGFGRRPASARQALVECWPNRWQSCAAVRLTRCTTVILTLGSWARAGCERVPVGQRFVRVLLCAPVCGQTPPSDLCRLFRKEFCVFWSHLA